jgi:hypothetical protein
MNGAYVACLLQRPVTIDQLLMPLLPPSVRPVAGNRRRLDSLLSRGRPCLIRCQPSALEGQ